jgi:hypothetical protein
VTIVLTAQIITQGEKLFPPRLVVRSFCGAKYSLQNLCAKKKMSTSENIKFRSGESKILLDLCILCCEEFLVILSLAS